MKTTQTGGISDTPRFPCPKWNPKKPGTLSFPGTPEEHVQECARAWVPRIKVLLEPNAHGLTNPRRNYLSKLLRQLETFLGLDE